MTAKTIRELVQNANFCFPQHQLFITKEEDHYFRLTCTETAEIVHQLGNGLLSRGVKHGDRIGIMAENRNEWPLVYLAVTCIGAIITPISILWEPEEVNKLSKKGELSMIFTSATYFNKVHEILMQVPSIRHLVCFDLLELPGEYLAFSDLIHAGKHLIAEGQDFFKDVVVQPTDTAEILFVNSSLGVKLSHEALLANVEGLYQTMQLHTTEDVHRALMLLPFSHLYPTVFGILMPLRAQWSAFTVATARMDHILRIVREIEPHYIFLVPLLLERLYTRLAGRLKKGEKTLSMLGFSNLAWIFTAGAKCPLTLLEQVTELRLIVLEGYGVSEMAPFITVNTPVHHRLGSVGKGLLNVEMCIHEPDSTGNGEVIARGPNMMQGYFAEPFPNAEGQSVGKTYIDELGWLHTGDIGKIDSDGFLFITGRKRNILVNKGGTNIYPWEIEQRLRQHPMITEARITAAWDETTGEYPVVYVQPNPDTTHHLSDQALKEELIKVVGDLNGKIAAYKIPRSLEIVQNQRK